MKVLLKVIGVLFCLVILNSCDTTSLKPNELSNFIPEEAAIVFKINDFEALKSDLKNNDLLSEFNKTEPYTFFSKNSFFKYLHPDSKSLLCISSKSNDKAFTFITKLSAGLFNLDSIPEKTVANLSFKKNTFQQITINQQQIYTTVRDSVFIASSSKNQIQNILSGNSKTNPIFKKIEGLKNNAELTTIFPVNAILINDSISVNLASWAALDVAVLPNAINASGVILEQDSIPQLLSVFKGLIPQHNDIAKITPIDALSVVSTTFNDFEIFQNNLQKFRAVKVTDEYKSNLFESISEIGRIVHPLGNAMILKSIDPALTFEELKTNINQKEVYKDVDINAFNKPDLFSDFLNPFLKKIKSNFVFKLDEFFVFTENIELANHIITSYLNNNCLSKTSYYQEVLPQLSDESSLLIIKMNGNYSKSISNLLQTNIGNISFKRYPLAILQFSYDRDFTHINIVCKEASSTKKSVGGVSQLVNIPLENELMGDLKFFSNHRSGGKDIIAQDVTNKLYFISASGKILWTKKLDGPILGSIHEVDILRNGKKQLAFTTKKTFYIIDRTGRPVAPFPKTFRDDITQPLSVFDYDKNRNYRFLITQGNELLMLNSKGKTVRGFKFKKSKSDIVLAPKHIRMATKDYILIAEKSGKLNILSRVGNSRINVSKSFDFSDIPIVKEGENFVVITKDSESSGRIKNSISQSGEVHSIKLKVTAYWFAINGKTKVTLDDNLMRINGKLVELPYGIYTPPNIFIEQQKTYITITETQENKVYIYNKLGELLPGFPIFGSSSIDIGDATKNGNLNFIVKGGASEIILFELQ